MRGNDDLEDSVFANMPLDNEQDFYLVNFGHSVTRPGHAYGFAVRSYYLIHYIVRGKGTFSVNQNTYTLQAGQGFFIAPDYRTRYISDEGDPWEYVWVGFCGKRAGTIVNSLGLSQESPIILCSAGQGEQLQQLVQKMLANDNFSLSGVYQRLGLLYQFMAVVADVQKDGLPQTNDNTYVQYILSYIREHVHESLTVQDLAAHMNLNRSYMTMLFKKYMHVSPGEYIKICRLTKARHLLESSDLSIARIAELCGYVRSESLNKLFKRQYGISPAAYRQQYGIRGKILGKIHTRKFISDL